MKHLIAILSGLVLLSSNTVHAQATSSNLPDQSNYADLTLEDFEKLFENSTLPKEADLAGTSWVCTSYTVLGKTETSVDYKTRRYFLNKNGLLQSVTNLDSDPLTWISTEDGLDAPVEGESCNKKITGHILIRISPDGNLISESGSHIDDVHQNCRAYYSKRKIARMYRAKKFQPLALDDGFIVNQREFCRPIRL